MSNERDNKGRFDGCPLAWCHTFEQCGTVKECLCAKYAKEPEGAYATAGVQYRDDRQSTRAKSA